MFWLKRNKIKKTCYYLSENKNQLYVLKKWLLIRVLTFFIFVSRDIKMHAIFDINHLHLNNQNWVYQKLPAVFLTACPMMHCIPLHIFLSAIIIYYYLLFFSKKSSLKLSKWVYFFLILSFFSSLLHTFVYIWPLNSFTDVLGEQT